MFRIQIVTGHEPRAVSEGESRAIWQVDLVFKSKEEPRPTRMEDGVQGTVLEWEPTSPWLVDLGFKSGQEPRSTTWLIWALESR